MFSFNDHGSGTFFNLDGFTLLFLVIAVIVVVAAICVPAGQQFFASMLSILQ